MKKPDRFKNILGLADMSPHLIIKSTSTYFDEVHKKWLPAPKHWIGDSVFSHPGWKITL